MPIPATKRQKEFLRRLGYKDVATVSKVQASQLIDQLLAEEQASGKSFPCPYCKKKFGPRPKRRTKCSSCGNTIIHLSGKFYTERQADELVQSDWLKEARRDRVSEVKEDWREEKRARKEFGEPMTVGYMVKAGPACPHAKPFEGLLVLLEDAYDTPDLLPPYNECHHDTCKCDFDPIMAGEVPKGTRVAEWEDPGQRAKIATREKRKVSTQKGKGGCALLVAAGVGLAGCLGFLLHIV